MSELKCVLETVDDLVSAPHNPHYIYLDALGGEWRKDGDWQTYNTTYLQWVPVDGIPDHILPIARAEAIPA